MSKPYGGILGRVSLVFAVVLTVGSCASRPQFVGEKLTTPCDGPAGNHTIPVDDFGSVPHADDCVVIGRSQANYVEWTPKSLNKDVGITFILSRDQPIPFVGMACSAPDPKGNRLCPLTTCPLSCKTVFLSSYQPVSPDPLNLNYYYYTPGITTHLGGTQQGADPGIRIVR